MSTGDNSTPDWDWPDDEPLEVAPLADSFNFFDIDASAEPGLDDAPELGGDSLTTLEPHRRRPVAALTERLLLPFAAVANRIGGRPRRPRRPGRARRGVLRGPMLVRIVAALLVATPAALVIKLLGDATSADGGRSAQVSSAPPPGTERARTRPPRDPDARSARTKRRIPANRPTRPTPRNRPRPVRPAHQTPAERRRARLIARLTRDVPDSAPTPVAVSPTPSLDPPGPADPAPPPPVEPRPEQRPSSPPQRPVDAAGTEFGFEG